MATITALHKSYDRNGNLISEEYVEVAEIFAAVEPLDTIGDLGIVNARLYGAVGDGVSDDSAAIQSAIEAASGTTVVIPAGRYVVGTLALPSETTMMMLSGATLMIRPGVNGPVLRIDGDGCSVFGGAIDGNASERSIGTPDGIRVNGAGARIDSVHIQNTGRYGVFSRASRTHVIDCHVQDSRSVGIYIEPPSTGGIEDCEISGCTVDRVALGNDLTEGGIKVHGYVSGEILSFGTRITNNIVRMPDAPADTSSICIEAWGFAPGSVIANNVTHGGEMGISADRSDGCAITGNVVNRAELRGIELARSGHCTVAGNAVLCDGVTGYGISLNHRDSSGHHSIAGNTVRAGALRGIHVSDTDRCTVTGNVVSMVHGHGIEFINASDGIASSNVLSASGDAQKAIQYWGETSGIVSANNLRVGWTGKGDDQ